MNQEARRAQKVREITKLKKLKGAQGAHRQCSARCWPLATPSLADMIWMKNPCAAARGRGCGEVEEKDLMLNPQAGVALCTDAQSAYWRKNAQPFPNAKVHKHA